LTYLKHVLSCYMDKTPTQYAIEAIQAARQALELLEAQIADENMPVEAIVLNARAEAATLTSDMAWIKGLVIRNPL